MKKYLASESGNHIRFLTEKKFDFTSIRTKVNIEKILKKYEKREAALTEIAKLRAEQAVETLSKEEKPTAFVVGCETFVSINKKILKSAEDMDSALKILNLHRENTVIVNTQVYAIGLRQNWGRKTIVQDVYKEGFGCSMSFRGLDYVSINYFAETGVAKNLFEGYDPVSKLMIDHCNVHNGDCLPFGVPLTYLNEIITIHAETLNEVASRKPKNLEDEVKDN